MKISLQVKNIFQFVIATLKFVEDATNSSQQRFFYFPND